MPSISIDVQDLVVLEGVAKTGKNVGKPYAFVKLDRRLANNQTFLAAVRQAGGKTINGAQGNGTPQQQNWQVNQ